MHTVPGIWVSHGGFLLNLPLILITTSLNSIYLQRILHIQVTRGGILVEANEGAG